MNNRRRLLALLAALVLAACAAPGGPSDRPAFLLGGGDGYQALKAAAEGPGARTTRLPEREQQILIDYMNRVLGRRVDLADPVTPPRVVRVGG